MLKVDHLTKIYRSSGGGPAGGISDASFMLEKGAFFTLLGPSGCGKTTTLRCIAGLNDPDTGRIQVADRVLFDGACGVAVPLHQRNIGMVFQSYAIWPHMTVAKNVSFPMRVSKSPRFNRSQIFDSTMAALASVGLESFADRSVTMLSGGQQQRVAFARAIVVKPQLLLLDEPLSNLDASLRESMREELKRLQQETGITTVYVTHDQTEALAMSDGIAVINEGEIVQLGTPRDIYFHPANEFVAGFIGNANIIHGNALDAVPLDGEGAVNIGYGMIVRCSYSRAVSANAPVALTVRPENIKLSLATGREEATGWNSLAGKVMSVSFLGNVIRYKVGLNGGHSIQVEGSPAEGFMTGDAVEVRFLPKHAIAVQPSQKG